MKTIIFFLGLFLSISAYSQENVTYVQDPVTEVINYTKTYNNGQVAETGTFNSDRQPHGEFRAYDENGNLLTVAYYRNGLKNGTWKHWTNDKYTQVVYSKGRMIKAIEEINFIASSN